MAEGRDFGYIRKLIYVQAGPTSLLFPGEARGHMWHSVMRSHFTKARAVAGRDNLKAHDLRHIEVTLAAAEVGATAAELQARQGHSTSVAAQLYQHAAKD